MKDLCALWAAHRPRVGALCHCTVQALWQRELNRTALRHWYSKMTAAAMRGWVAGAQASRIARAATELAQSHYSRALRGRVLRAWRLIVSVRALGPLLCLANRCSVWVVAGICVHSGPPCPRSTQPGDMAQAHGTAASTPVTGRCCGCCPSHRQLTRVRTPPPLSGTSSSRVGVPGASTPGSLYSSGSAGQQA